MFLDSNKENLESRIGSMHKPGLYDYEKNVTTTLGEVDSHKLGLFGYVFEAWVGCLLQVAFRDGSVIREPLVEGNGRSVKPDFQVEHLNHKFLVEVKSGVKMNGFTNRLNEYTTASNTVCIIHRKDTALGAHLLNSYKNVVYTTTDDRMLPYQDFYHCEIARLVRNKYDFLKHNSVRQIKGVIEFIEDIYESVENQSTTERELLYKFSSFDASAEN